MKTILKVPVLIAIAVIFCAHVAQGQTSYSGTGSNTCSPAASTSGVNNTFIGCGAALLNNGAKINVAVGDSALYTQSFSNAGVPWISYNVALGNEALYKTLSTSTSNGIQNTATGVKSLYSNTTGSNNTASGFQSGYYNQTGSNNTISGFRAGGFGNLATASFSDNSIFGYQAGYNTTTGGSNSYFGRDAAYQNKTGVNNTVCRQTNVNFSLVSVPG